MRKTITGFLASTIILSQLSGGLKALAVEEEVIHIEEEVEESSDDPVKEDNRSDETVEMQSNLSEEDEHIVTLVEDDEINDDILSTETNNESEVDEWVPVKEDEIDEYEDYFEDNDNTYSDDDDYYFEILNQIEEIDVKFSSTEIVRNEDILVYVNLGVETDITYLEMELSSNSGNNHWLGLYYNDESDRFEALFNFTQSDFTINADREISVTSVRIEDVYAHSKYLSANNNEINASTLVNPIPVHESVPVIKMDSLSASSNEIFGNEQIQIELELNSDVPMERVEIQYEYNEYDQYTVTLEQFRDSNRYIGFFRKPYADMSTVFEVTSVIAEDSYGNTASIYSANDGIDLSNLSIVYTHQSSVSAEDAKYVEDSLTVSREEADIGDVIEYSVKLENPGDIYSITLSLSRVDDSGSKIVKLYYDNASDTYIGEWKINRSDLSGEWIPDYIERWSTQSWFYNEFAEDKVMNSHLVNVTADETDIEQPDIKLTNIRADKAEAPINSSNTIFMDIESAVSVDYFQLTLYGTHVYHPVTYNHQTGEFQAVIYLHETYTDTIEFNQLIAAIDGEHFIVDTDDVDLSKFSIKLLDAEETPADDEKAYSAPVMDYESLTIFDSIVKAGETVTVTVPISEFQNVSSASIMYVTPVSNGNVSVEFIYNAETELFEAVIETNETSESGLWRVDSIYMVDTDYNYSSIYPWDDNSYEILRNLSFILEGGVSSVYKPSLELKAIDLEGVNYTTGETVSISVETTEKTYDFITIYYRLPVSGQIRPVNLTYSPDSGNYEGHISVTDNTESGRWLIEKVGADGNEESFISDIRLLANGGFRVSNANTTSEKPTVNQESYNASFDEKMGSLTITAEATDSNLVRGMFVTYIDLNNDETYVIQLEKSEDDAAYIGVLDMPLDIDLDSLVMSSIELLGYEGHIVQRVFSDFVNPFGGIDASFANISVIVNEEDDEFEDSEDVDESDANDDTDDSEEPAETEDETSNDTDDSGESDADAPTDEELEEKDEIENTEEDETGTSVETDDEEDVSIEDDTTENTDNSDSTVTEEYINEDDNEVAPPSTENNQESLVEEKTNNESSTEEVKTEAGSGAENQSTDESSVDISLDPILSTTSNAEETNVSGLRLPSTATATWSVGLIGLLSAAAGSVLKFSKKK